MHALIPISRHKCSIPTPGIVLELGPRIVFILHDRLASFGAIPGNLKTGQDIRHSETLVKRTYVTRRLALVARLHGFLGTIHIFGHRVRRCQAITTG